MSMNDNLADILSRWIDMFIHKSINDMVQFSKLTGLSMPQIAVLTHLYSCNECEVTAISNFISGSHAAASQIVERLLQQGLVERKSVDGDRRVRHVFLTEQGRQLIQQGVEARQQWMERFSGRFTSEEQKEIVRALELLIDKGEDLFNDKPFSKLPVTFEKDIKVHDIN